MRKRKLVLPVLLALALLIPGCGKSGEEAPAESTTMEATVISVDDGGLLVEPVEGSRELRSADRIRVPLGDTDPVPAAGDRIEVVYNGVIQESYPAGLGEVYSIRVVAGGEETRRTKPPALTVQWGRASVEALLGAYSWQYANGDGTWSSVEADSLHPLQAKAYMTPLYLSGQPPFPISLLFAAAPDEVTVICWGEEAWDQMGIPGEELAALPSADPGGAFTAELAADTVICQVTARWDSAGTWGGTAHYGFYTLLSDG